MFEVYKKGLAFLTILVLASSLLVWDSAYAKAKSSSISRAESVYRQARAGYDRLAKSARLRTDRRAWTRVIKRFRSVYLTYPNNKKVAPKALFMMARCYRELYGYSRSGKDIEQAIKRYQVLVEKFPKSRLADDALYGLGEVYKRTGRVNPARKAWEQLIEDYPKSDKAKNAKRRLKALGPKPRRKSVSPSTGPKIALGAKPAIVEDVRYWSGPDYTRIVIDTSGPVSFKRGYLPADIKRKLPERVFLDLKPAIKGNGINSRINMGSGSLKRVRVAQFRRDTVRVVFDFGTPGKTKVFYLKEPFRVVADVFGKDYFERPSRPSHSTTAKKDGKKGNSISLAQQLGLCVKRIVVDAGHGGKDPGAIGPTGLKEKDVVLKIAKKVTSRLKKKLGCRVILTREQDRFLSLEQRTAIANAKKADLFVSIHANAAPNRKIRGVETFFLNFALDEDAMRVAARENATVSRRIGELKNILNDIMKNAKVDESSRLAGYIQKEVVGSLRKKYTYVKNRGVKQAPFFVLIGARMPSILVEVSFISNRKEEKRLKNDSYLDRVAEGIVNGIESYMNDNKYAYNFSDN